MKDKGGTIHRQPADIPGVGRFAIVSDPQGVMFALFKGAGTTTARLTAANLSAAQISALEGKVPEARPGPAPVAAARYLDAAPLCYAAP